MIDDRSDLTLMRASRADPSAFGQLYERHAAVIHAWLRARVGEPAATDLTAETFAAAWTARRRFRSHEATSVVPWLYGIALNQYRSYARLTRVETLARARLGMQSTYAASNRDTDEVEDRIDADQFSQRLEHALGYLSPDQRCALELRAIDDLSYAEIAARTMTSQTTARARVSRALRTLRTVIGGAP